MAILKNAVAQPGAFAHFTRIAPSPKTNTPSASATYARGSDCGLLRGVLRGLRRGHRSGPPGGSSDGVVGLLPRERHGRDDAPVLSPARERDLAHLLDDDAHLRPEASGEVGR